MTTFVQMPVRSDHVSPVADLYVNVDALIAFGTDVETGATILLLDGDEELETPLTPQQVDERIHVALNAAHADLDSIRDDLVEIRKRLP